MNINRILDAATEKGTIATAQDDPYDEDVTAVYSAVDWQQDGLSGVRKGPDCYDGVCL